MSETNYAIAFKGEVTQGSDVGQVKATLAKMFKATPEHIEKLFTGKPVALKKGLDEETARKYQAAFLKAGAVTHVVNTAKPAADKPAPPKAPPAPADGADSGFLKYTVKPAPKGLGELEGISVAAPGVELVEHQEVVPPVIDTQGLDMAAPGVELVEHQEVVPPVIDTQGLDMAEPGAVLVEAEEIPALEVDTGDISMADPGVTLVEPKAVEVLDIDTSKLSMS